MTREEEYRRNAEEAEKKADAANDQGAKRIYLDIAENWRTMAEQAKRYGW